MMFTYTWQDVILWVGVGICVCAVIGYAVIGCIAAIVKAIKEKI